MIKLDLVTDQPESHLPEVNTEVLEAGEEAPAQSLFQAMKGALRRTDRADLSGFGFFVVKRRKRAQEAVSLLAAVFESSSDAIIGATLKGKIVTWNRGAQAIFGYTADEVSGCHLSLLAADGQGTEIMDALASLKRGANAVELETEAATRDGRSLVLQVTVSSITNNKGKALAASLVARDVTERRRAQRELRLSEESFRALVEQSADLVAVLERDGKIRSVNFSVRRLLGYTPAEVLGKSPLDWIHSGDAREVIQAAQRFVEFETGGSVRFRARHSDGSWRTIEATARRLIDDVDGGVIINARDITERLHIEEQLRLEYGRAQRMEAVETLAGAIAQRLDDSLTTICGYTELIINQLGNSPVGGQNRTLEEMHLVKKAARRAATLSGQLLVFSQKQLLRPKVLDINSVVADLDPILRRLLGDDIAVVTMLDPEVGRIMADKRQIELAIVHIAVNARDAMPQGGTLTIETMNMEVARGPADSPGGIGPGRYVVLSIRDSGRGMEPETQSRIFEPFYTTKEDGSALGVGLSMAYGIIKQSQGHISVCSEPGVGTSFRICFPRECASGDVSITRGESEELPRGTETVLLLQPDDGVRSLAREILLASGYAVVEARSPRDALELCEAYPASLHLLVADSSCDDMAPREIATRVLMLRPQIKLLFTHGYTDDAVVRQELANQDWTLLRKPFTPAALARKTREVLDESPAAKAQSCA